MNSLAGAYYYYEGTACVIVVKCVAHKRRQGSMSTGAILDQWVCNVRTPIWKLSAHEEKECFTLQYNIEICQAHALRLAGLICVLRIKET